MRKLYTTLLLLLLAALIMAPTSPGPGVGGSLQFGAGPPTTELCANVGKDRYTDTTNDEEYFCSPTDTWKRYISSGGSEQTYFAADCSVHNAGAVQGDLCHDNSGADDDTLWACDAASCPGTGWKVTAGGGGGSEQTYFAADCTIHNAGAVEGDICHDNAGADLDTLWACGTATCPGSGWQVVSGSGGTDSNAIHKAEDGEISLINLKATPVNGDFILIEDSAAGNAKKRATLGTLPSTGGGEVNVTADVGAGAVSLRGATPKTGDSLNVRTLDASDFAAAADILSINDTNWATQTEVDAAFHKSTPGEISAATLKAAPVNGDFILIEDSAAGDAKKRVTVGTLPLVVFNDKTPKVGGTVGLDLNQQPLTDSELIEWDGGAFTTHVIEKYPFQPGPTWVCSHDANLICAGDQHCDIDNDGDGGDDDATCDPATGLTTAYYRKYLAGGTGTIPDTACAVDQTSCVCDSDSVSPCTFGGGECGAEICVDNPWQANDVTITETFNAVEGSGAADNTNQHRASNSMEFSYCSDQSNFDCLVEYHRIVKPPTGEYAAVAGGRFLTDGINADEGLASYTKMTDARGRVLGVDGIFPATGITEGNSSTGAPFFHIGTLNLATKAFDISNYVATDGSNTDTVIGGNGGDMLSVTSGGPTSYRIFNGEGAVIAANILGICTDDVTVRCDQDADCSGGTPTCLKTGGICLNGDGPDATEPLPGTPCTVNDPIDGTGCAGGTVSDDVCEAIYSYAVSSMADHTGQRLTIGWDDAGTNAIGYCTTNTDEPCTDNTDCDNQSGGTCTLDANGRTMGNMRGLDVDVVFANSSAVKGPSQTYVPPGELAAGLSSNDMTPIRATQDWSGSYGVAFNNIHLIDLPAPSGAPQESKAFDNTLFGFYLGDQGVIGRQSSTGERWSSIYLEPQQTTICTGGDNPGILCDSAADCTGSEPPAHGTCDSGVNPGRAGGLFMGGRWNTGHIQLDCDIDYDDECQHIFGDRGNDSCLTGTGNPYPCCTAAGEGTCSNIRNYTSTAAGQGGGPTGPTTGDVLSRVSNSADSGIMYWGDRGVAASNNGDKVCEQHGLVCLTSLDPTDGSEHACNVTQPAIEATENGYFSALCHARL